MKVYFGATPVPARSLKPLSGVARSMEQVGSQWRFQYVESNPNPTGNLLDSLKSLGSLWRAIRRKP